MGNLPTSSTVASGEQVRRFDCHCDLHLADQGGSLGCVQEALSHCSAFFLLGSGHKGQQTNLITAMIKYGTDKNRFAGMTKEDIKLASETIGPDLMNMFGYELPSIY